MKNLEPKISHAVEESAPTRHRVQLDFSFEAYERLLALRSKSGVRTNAELVRNALRLFEWYLRIREEGQKIQLVKDNEIREVEIVF
jgi:hypothetical protein